MTNAKAIVIARTGGPEVLEWRDITVPAPGPGEILIRHTAIGVDFIDIYHRTGLYPVPLPFIPGQEAAGVVEAVGDGVKDFHEGDRVAYPAGPAGAYATHRLFPAARAVKLPDAIDDETAAAVILKGSTVHMLLQRTFKVEPHHTVLLHAAAGGVGQLAVQWLKSIGATVIATAGGAEKCAIVRALGADHVIDYKSESFLEGVKEITNGQGVDVVYDSIGKATFMDSLDCLKRLGTMVTFGNATGPVDPIPPGLLATKGSLFLTRPILMHYFVTRDEITRGTEALFEQIRSGKIKPAIGQSWKLQDAGKAQVALESRATTGSSILIP